MVMTLVGDVRFDHLVGHPTTAPAKVAVDSLPPVFFTHDIPNPFRHGPSENFVTIFGDPDDMVLDVVHRMGSFSIAHRHHL